MTPSPANPPGGFYPPPRSPAPPAPTPGWRGRLTVLFTSLCLFMTACAVPALVFKRNGTDAEVWLGIQVLAFGWMGALLKQFAWYANPFTVIGLIFLLFRRWTVAFIFMTVALVFAANTLLLFSQELPADEANVNKLMLDRLGVGFYFWVASMLVVAIGAVILRQRSRRATRPPE